MPPADDVPPEIWELIAGYLPRSERPQLISLNRYFLAKTLQERYGEVKWTILDGNMLRCLRRLQDPFIAKYVQKLQVQAWFVTQLSHRKAPPRTLHNTLGRSVSNLLQVILDYFVPQAHVSTPLKGPTKYTASQILTLMARALSQMTNLTCYYFEWRDLPLTKDSQLFLHTVQNSAHSLRELILHARIANFKYLLDYVYFENLEDISFHFNYDASSDKTGLEEFIEVNSGILENEVAPFINRLAPSLLRLSITVDTITPMNSLFKSLIFLPNLRDVEFNMSFGTTTSPLALLNFLSTHSSTLRSVKFDPPYQRWARYHGAPEPQFGPESRLRVWSTISDLLLKSKSTLSNLENLDIPSTGSITTTLALIQRSAATLTRLSLSGRYFTQAELLTIYGVFSSRPLYARLLHLRVDVTGFTLNVLYDIGLHFPRLESLILVTEDEPETASLLSPHMIQTFHEWGLLDLNICVERYQEHQNRSSPYALNEYNAMVKVRRFVGSIKYFRGEEHSKGAEILTSRLNW